MKEQKNWKKEFFKIMTILKDNGVDLKVIQIRITKQGKRLSMKLKDIEQSGINIENIIKENKLDGNYPIGANLAKIRQYYKGKDNGELLSDEERATLEEWGIQSNNLFKGKNKEYERTIIEEYLPQILNKEITIKEIRKILHTTEQSISKVIRNYYFRTGQEEKWEEYKEIKKHNIGNPPKTIKKKIKAEQKVAEYNVVSGRKFLTLSDEEQDSQVFMKVRKSKLTERKNVKRILTEKNARDLIQKTKEYFRAKNENGEENFSEQSIRYIIFMYPTIINRSAETLDEKIDAFTSFDGINIQEMYEMIKKFPSIIGYSTERIKSQLNLLQEENAMRFVKERPTILVNSVELMYAIIEYTKDRLKINNFDNVNINEMFMSDSDMKRIRHISYKQLKELYPYNKEQYAVDGQMIGKATYKDVHLKESEQANDAINELLNEKQITK